MNSDNVKKIPCYCVQKYFTTVCCDYFQGFLIIDERKVLLKTVC